MSLCCGIFLAVYELNEHACFFYSCYNSTLQLNTVIVYIIKFFYFSISEEHGPLAGVGVTQLESGGDSNFPERERYENLKRKTLTFVIKT